ncbi:unnamed protein product [Cyclocybe aegerita]|uniref:Acyl-CoA oxidase C-alpha1 domain-containing protein n=1 Tax=Cyclocybe aegerita TaxID=1973307 RepID=A0A8S0VUI4_CYCAE|nr:unnamed protein product [Cyclocybe aegerita]
MLISEDDYRTFVLLSLPIKGGHHVNAAVLGIGSGAAVVRRLETGTLSHKPMFHADSNGSAHMRHMGRKLKSGLRTTSLLLMDELMPHTWSGAEAETPILRPKLWGKPPSFETIKPRADEGVLPRHANAHHLLSLPMAMYPTRELAQSPLFRIRTEMLPKEEQISLSYARAKAIVKSYGCTAKDITELSPKFWKLHLDPIWSVDGAAGTLCTIQLNLCAGTLCRFASKSAPWVQETLQKVLSFEYCGQYCVTEVGHGLDAFHMETTATLLDNGEFELHTPSEAGAKFMPPTAPMGDPTIAVVFAKTMVNGESHGIKPFLVPINDGVHMHKGVTCKVLPHRGGSRHINHSLTSFNKVRLPYTSLLCEIDKPQDPRTAFFKALSSVAIGTMAIGSLGVPALQVASYIAARYSLRRKVIDTFTGKASPIINFRTQKTPVLTALAQSFVMQAFQEATAKVFTHTKDIRVCHAVGAIMKIVMMQHGQAANLGLSDRCGAQGLFSVNQLTTTFCDMRGTAIAEGDTLALSIKLASELLLGRYSLPPSSDPTSLLAQHEQGLLEEYRGLLKTIGHHRSADFDRLILPECLALVQAIGHRMAYDAAVAKGVEKYILDLYVASCLKLDPSWYVEKLSIPRSQIREMEALAVDAVFPHLEDLLGRLGVEPYITAPIVSDENWAEFVKSIPPLVAPEEKVAEPVPVSEAPPAKPFISIKFKQAMEVLVYVGLPVFMFATISFV